MTQNMTKIDLKIEKNKIFDFIISQKFLIHTKLLHDFMAIAHNFLANFLKVINLNFFICITLINFDQFEPSTTLKPLVP